MEQDNHNANKLSSILPLYTVQCWRRCTKLSLGLRIIVISYVGRLSIQVTIYIYKQWAVKVDAS